MTRPRAHCERDPRATNSLGRLSPPPHILRARTLVGGHVRDQESPAHLGITVLMVTAQGVGPRAPGVKHGPPLNCTLAHNTPLTQHWVQRHA